MELKELTNKVGVQGPVVTIVMDGVGIAPDGAGDAVKNAYTPTLDMLMAKYPWVKLQAHGKAVGLMSDDDMGNSEVLSFCLDEFVINHCGEILRSLVCKLLVFNIPTKGADMNKVI